MSLAKLAVLGILMEKPMHGYELKQYFERRMGIFWMINYGSIYPTLRNLEKKKLVVGRKQPSATVDRIVYKITPRGREEFSRLLSERCRQEAHVRDEFTLHLFFLDYLDKSEALKLLKEKLAANEMLLEHLNSRKEDLKKVLPRYRYSALERGIRHVKVEIAWLRSVIEEGEKVTSNKMYNIKGGP